MLKLKVKFVTFDYVGRFFGVLAFICMLFGFEKAAAYFRCLWLRCLAKMYAGVLTHVAKNHQ